MAYLNGNGTDGYSKSQKKVISTSKSKFLWYCFTLVAVTAVVTMTMDYNEYAPSEKQEKKRKRKQRPIKQISILGERNSGTRWTWGHLNSCFNHSLIVTRSLTRYKHWFQNRNTSRYAKDVLVIAQFRNPYDWIEAMRKVPHHAPAHLDLEWEEFVTKEWNTPRIGLDLNVTDPLTLCQQKFFYRDINSCFTTPNPGDNKKHRYSSHQPFYEMRNDGSGEPYANIMEMRADKIRNMLSVWDFDGVRDVWVTQYEYLLARGTKGMLDHIAEITGVDYKCDPFPIQNRRRRPVTPEFAEFLNQHLDWNAEALVGYSKEGVKTEQ